MSVAPHGDWSAAFTPQQARQRDSHSIVLGARHASTA